MKITECEYTTKFLYQFLFLNKIIDVIFDHYLVS